MKKVLITGAAGFLGSHLSELHLRRGDQIWAIDNFSTSSPTTAHFAQLSRHHGFHFFDADITNWEEMRGFVNCNVDLIYNFACPASPPRYQEMPVETMLTSVVGTKNVLEIARRSRNAVLIQASTSEVYGDPTVSPQPESYVGNVNSYGPRSCYDEGKRAAEALCFDYLHKYNVDARLVRIFNTYGPNMDPDDGRVVTNFIKQALKGEKITIYGTGKQTRSFTYVSDLIDGIVKLASLEKNPRTPINVGNPVEFTMMDLAVQVLSTINKWSGDPLHDMIVHAPLPTDDPMQRRPDITLANKLLQWEPKVSLQEGLKLMVPYMREVLKVGKIDSRLV